MTSRALVIPANPQTASQQSNRNIFSYVQQAVRSFGPTIYRNAFDRGVEDLPGYQSMLSLFRRGYSKDSSSVWSVSQVNPDTLLGELHFPNSVTPSNPSGDILRITFSTELGENGSDNDQVFLVATDATVDLGDPESFAFASASAVRSDGQIEIDPSPNSWTEGPFYTLVFYNSLNESALQRSIAKWGTENI